MAASNSQRNWNRFFDKSTAMCYQSMARSSCRGLVSAKVPVSHTMTTCEHYEKSMETCRLSGEMCMLRQPDVAGA